MEAVLFIGIQGSGKSTLFKQRFADTHVRINLDMLKTRYREQLLVRACVEGRTRFVVDNTNASRQERARYIPLARAARFRVIGYYLQSELAACLARNEARIAPVPAAALYGTHKRLEAPILDEGFDDLFYVRQMDGGFVVEDWASGAR